eukprot:469953_1
MATGRGLQVNNALCTIIFVIQIYCIQCHNTVIGSSTNYQWTDDFTCGHDGWRECSFYYIVNNPYHGIYHGSDYNLATTEHITLSRKFECARSGNLYVQFWVGFDCKLDGSTTDGVDFYFNSDIAMPGCCDFSNAQDGTLEDHSLPSFEGQCNKNQPWLLQKSPLYVQSVSAYEVITLTWDIMTSHIDHQMILYDIQLTCAKPTASPTPSPTALPTPSPTIDPTADPTTDPTVFPTTDPTYDPTADPTKDPTKDPTVDPTLDPTIDPTKDPTVDPTIDPTMDPTSDPTTDPTIDPTMDPTWDPTIDPTNDPSRDPTIDPTIDPTVDPTSDPTLDPTREPTTEPTRNPTADPTTDPTMNPSYDPIGVVSYQWFTFNGTRFIGDAYSRFQVSIVMRLEQLKQLNSVSWFVIDYESYTSGGNWTQITMEKYKLVNIYTAKIIDSYKLEELGYDATDMVYSSVLTLNALRVLNSGYCYNTTLAPNHLLQPGTQYIFKIEMVADSIKNAQYDEYFESEYLHLSTNQFARGGSCTLRLLNPKIKGKAQLLDRFYFDCDDWEDPDSIDHNFTLRFNGMMNDVLINNELVSELWTDDPQDIIGMIGTPALEIKILIRDDLGAITCQEMNVRELFPHVKLTDGAILAAVRGVISETPLGQDNSVGIVLYTVLADLLAIEYADSDTLQDIMDLIVVNVVDTSHALNLSETSASRLISESTMVRALLSNPSLVWSESASLLMEVYLPSMFNAIDSEIVDDALDASIGDSLNMIGVKALDLSGKLEVFLSADMDAFEVDHNEMLESFVEYGAYSGHVALSQSYPGDVFEYHDPDGQRNITTSKIDPNNTDNADYQRCGGAQSNIMIPNTISDSFFDCSFVDQKKALFETDDDPKNTLSNTVTINLYDGDVMDSVFDTRRRRRRLGVATETAELSASHLDSTNVKDACNPFWIKIDLAQNDNGLYADGGKGNKYSLNGANPYPSCTFWNVTNKEWDTNNCFVYNYTDEYVLCACQHLTTFNV